MVRRLDFLRHAWHDMQDENEEVTNVEKMQMRMQPRSQTLYSNFCIRELNLRIGDLLLSLPGAFRVGVCGGHSSDR